MADFRTQRQKDADVAVEAALLEAAKAYCPDPDGLSEHAIVTTWITYVHCVDPMRTEGENYYHGNVRTGTPSHGVLGLGAKVERFVDDYEAWAMSDEEDD